MKGRIEANWKRGRMKTLFFVYYTGYAVTADFTYAVCDMAESPF